MDMWKWVLLIVVLLGLLWWYRPEYFYLIKDNFCNLIGVC